MRHANGGKGLPAVNRAVHHHIVDVDRIGIGRIGEDVRVVPGALHVVPILINILERLTRVVRAIESRFRTFRFDEREDPIRVGRRDGDADAARGSFGKPLGELVPRVAAIRRFVDTALDGIPAQHRERLALRVRHRRVENARIAGIHR